MTKFVPQFSEPQNFTVSASISVHNRWIAVTACGDEFRSELPSHLIDMELSQHLAEQFVLLMLLPLAAKFVGIAPQLVPQWVVDEISGRVIPERPESVRRSLRGAMTAAGVSGTAQLNILNAMSELEPSTFR